MNLATCFRNAKSFEHCKDCLLKAADCHKQNRSLFHAAKCLDQVNVKLLNIYISIYFVFKKSLIYEFVNVQVVLISKEMNNLADVQQFAEKACHLYQVMLVVFFLFI